MSDDKRVIEKLTKIGKRLNMIVVCSRAEILGISEKTIERMLPFRQIKQSRNKR